MLSLYRRRGSPYYYAKGYDEHGKEWRESTGCKDRRAAERRARQIERRRAAEADLPEAVPLRDGIAAVLRADERAGRSDSTRELHRAKGGHLMRLLGPDYNIADVTAEDLRHYADARIAEYPTDGIRHSVRKELGVLRQAIRTLELPWNPRLMPDLGRYYVPRERWLTWDEYCSLWRELQPERRDYLAVWVYTGIDESPLYRITADDVDLARGQLWVPDTKTAHRPRWVPLHPEARAVLEKRMDRKPMFREWGNSRRDLHAACRRAGVAPVSCKDLRRTFASWLAQAGVPMKATADLMGHASLRMVEQVYARLGVDTYQRAISALPTAGTRSDTKCVPDPRVHKEQWDTGDGDEAL